MLRHYDEIGLLKPVEMPEVYSAAISWVKENGYEPDGAMFNIYHVSPHETQNKDKSASPPTATPMEKLKGKIKYADVG